MKDWICVQFWHIRRFLKLSAAERLYELDLETQVTPEAATMLGCARLAIEKQLKLTTAMALSELMFMGNAAIRDILQPLLEARSVMRAARVPVARTRVEEAEFATICTAPSLLTCACVASIHFGGLEEGGFALGRSHVPVAAPMLGRPILCGTTGGSAQRGLGRQFD